MKECGSRTIPAELSRAAARLDEWRRQRVKGERIPAPLWNMVLDLARRYGVSRTATTVRIGYYGLKKRLAATVSLVDPQHSTSTTALSNCRRSQHRRSCPASASSNGTDLRGPRCACK